MQRGGTVKNRRFWRSAAGMALVLPLLSACLCQKPASGQEASRPPTEPRKETVEQPVAGGFQAISLDEDQVAQAYAYLSEELPRRYPAIQLGEVKQAARQIVAGSNIRLVCRYQLPPGTGDRELTAVVYFDLKGARSLRSLSLTGGQTQ